MSRAEHSLETTMTSEQDFPDDISNWELLLMEEKKFEEQGFRRGYLRGFEDGVNSLKKLEEKGMSLEEAADKCQQFLEKNLDQWRYRNLDVSGPPPQLER
jgi:hypothetical protein